MQIEADLPCARSLAPQELADWIIECVLSTLFPLVLNVFMGACKLM